MQTAQAMAGVVTNGVVIKTFHRWHMIRSRAYILGWCDEDWEEIVALCHERSSKSSHHTSLDFMEMCIRAYMAGCNIPGLIASLRNPTITPDLDF